MCCKRTDFVINYQSYTARSHPNEYWFVEKPLRLQILKRYDHRKIRPSDSVIRRNQQKV